MNIVIHRLQHVSIFVTAALFRWSVVRRSDFGGAEHFTCS
jgi:cytochrome c oxidase assembly factor CtaG